MASDPVTILKDIGRRYGKRVSRTNHFDANVCMSPVDHERPWEILALPGDIFRHKLNITFGDRKITLHANGGFIAATVSGNLEVDVCSINRQDKIFQLDLVQPRVPGFESLPVYSRQPHTDLRQLLNSLALVNALNALRLTGQESVHIYRNGIVLYLQRDSKKGILSAVEIACNLAEQLPTQ
jgi:hypothetical protein